MRADPVELRAEIIKVCQIANPDRAAADFVFVSRPDPAPGRADFARATGIFAQSIEIAVERQDQRGIFGDLQVLRIDLDALPLELGHFIAEVPGIEHHAVADQAERSGDDAAGQQGELVDVFANHQRVPGVVSALKTDHGIGAAGQPVDNLALAFIAPLGADHGNVGHGNSFARASNPCRALGEAKAEGKAHAAPWARQSATNCGWNGNHCAIIWLQRE